MSSKDALCELLKVADIEINGTRAWDIQVHDERLYKRVLAGGALAVGESYMDEWWSSDQLDETVFRILRAGVHQKIKNSQLLLQIVLAFVTNRQSTRRAFQVGERHYDIGNELYVRMLDSHMQYSCGYWKEAQTLEKAQEAKMDLICRKLGIKEGMRVLDIGCGWGGLAAYMAEKCGATVTGVTVSKEQVKLAQERTKGLSVEIALEDYRSLKAEPFDRIVSVGMFEHVGYKNYRNYMQKVHDLLRDDGIFLLHSIGHNYTKLTFDPWFDKYIFPNGSLPSIMHIGKSIERLFVMEDWHNFGADYEKTLLAWYENFSNAWPLLKRTGKYDRRFYRMWKYYLLSMAGAFRSRVNNQLWQIVLSKRGVVGGYRSVR